MRGWKKTSSGIYVRDDVAASTYIKRVDIGASGLPLMHLRRPYAGAWALATGDPYIEEYAYAFYNDGTESGSVIIGSANSQQTITVNTIFFIRFCIINSGTYGYKNLYLDFYYNHNDAGWPGVQITTSSTVIQAVSSDNVAEEDDCTPRLTHPSFTFVTNNDAVTEDGTSGSANTDVDQDYYYNCLLVARINAAYVSHGDEINVRPVFSGGSVLDNYAHSDGADIDVNKPAVARRIFIT